MHRPLIATLAAIVTLSSCVQPQPHEPAAAPTSEASPTAAIVPPAPPTTTPSPVEADKSQSPTPAPPAPPKETARNTPSNPPAASRSAPNATQSPPQGSSTPAKPPIAAAAPAEAPASPPLDLDGLEQRLRDTHAIGVFTKLSLKNQVNDLLDQFRGFHEGQIKVPLADLRQRYEQLLLNVVTLLQDSDEPLAKAVASSREAIWGVLADPKTFAKI
jgi:hypothetical protein